MTFLNGRQILDNSIALIKIIASGTRDATTFLRGDGVFAVPPGGGGGITKGIVEVDFGAITQQSEIARVTVLDASITATSYPTVSPYAITTANHDPDDYSVELISATVSNIVVGVSFDIVAIAPNLTFGKYKFVYHY